MTEKTRRGEKAGLGWWTRGLARAVLLSAGAACASVAFASAGEPGDGTGQTQSIPQASTPALTAQTPISVEDVRVDLAVLRRAYTLLHPGLLRYNTPEQLNAAWDALERDLAVGDAGKPTTLGAMYLRVSQFLATVRCGHSYANFFNQRKAVVAALFTGRNRVPFNFRWFDGEMIVTRNYSDDASLTPGLRVSAVNGVPTREIQGKLMTIARADGGNDDKRRRLIEVSGLETWETFDIFYPMFFPVTDGAFSLTVRDATGAERVVRVAAQSEADRTQQLVRARAEAAEAARSVKDAELLEDGVWEFRTLADGSAYLRMRSWAFYNSKADWQGFIHNVCDRMIASGTKNFIVDLRGNEGGNDCGDVLLERLIDTPLAKPRFERRVMYRKTPEDLNPYLDTWDDSFKDWGGAAKDPKPGDTRPGFVLDRGEENGDDNMIRPSRTKYPGRVWVLVDSVNSSATFQFAWIVSRSKIATLVGEPTGGNQRGINGGAFFFLRLPKTGIEVDLPIIATHPIVEAGEGPVPDAGVTPDVVVRVTPQDIASGRDAALEKTLELIKAHR